jgi:signal peptidase
MIFTILSAVGVNKENNLLGYGCYIVLSDSMRDTFEVGDLIFSRKADASELSEGDIITFKSSDPTNYGAIVTHKIRAKTEHEGRPAFVTYGSTTGDDDNVPAPAENVIGKYAGKIPAAGYAFSFLKTWQGYFMLILAPFIGLMAFEGANFLRLFKRYKIEREARELKIEETEREKEVMERELAELRNALAKREPPPPAAELELTEESVENPKKSPFNPEDWNIG